MVIISEVLDTLQCMSPYRKRAATRGLCIEVMSLVLNDQTDVEIASEVDRKLDLGYIRDLDNIRRIAPLSTVGAGSSDARRDAADSLKDGIV